LIAEYSMGTSGCDGVIRIWNISTVRGNKDEDADFVKCDVVETLQLTGHESDVHDIRFNISGTLIASIGLDKILRIWQVCL